MAEPNNYITATQNNFVSNDNEGRMVEKCIVEIQGTFLEKIPAYEWFTNECMGLITTWDSMVEKFIMKFHHLSDHNDDEDIEEEEDPNETDNAPEIFMIEGNLFDFETPYLKTYDEYEQELNNDEANGTDEMWLEKGAPYQLCDHICEPYRFKNGKTKWPTCTSDIDGFCNGGELPGMVRVRSMTYFQDHKWYDEFAHGKLKDETLALKVNAHKIAQFTRMENFERGPYENMKTEWVSNPYLDNNHISGRDYEASNVSCTQENQKDDPIPEPSNCKVGRFEMMKYSFNDDKEYITIKESEYLNHSRDSLDAYQEFLRLIDDGWVLTTPDDE
ncbi:hypothetical protein Tco_0116904 [Tanacetum coccineum]